MMEDLSIPALTTASGLAVFLATLIMLGIQAYKKNIWWGLGYSAVPLVGLYFLYQNWGKNQKTSIIHLAGIAIAAVGYHLAEGF